MPNRDILCYIISNEVCAYAASTRGLKFGLVSNHCYEEISTAARICRNRQIIVGHSSVFGIETKPCASLRKSHLDSPK